MGGRRRRRRVQYYAPAVVLKIVSNKSLLGVVRVVYSASAPLRTREVAERMEKLGFRISADYARKLLSRLEKWGVVRCFWHPDGGLLWAPMDRGPARLLRERLKQIEAEETVSQLETSLGGVVAGAGTSD